MNHLLQIGGHLVIQGGHLVSVDDPADCECCGTPQCSCFDDPTWTLSNAITRTNYQDASVLVGYFEYGVNTCDTETIDIYIRDTIQATVWPEAPTAWSGVLISLVDGAFTTIDSDVGGGLRACGAIKAKKVAGLRKIEIYYEASNLKWYPFRGLEIRIKHTGYIAAVEECNAVIEGGVIAAVDYETSGFIAHSGTGVVSQNPYSTPTAFFTSLVNNDIANGVSMYSNLECFFRKNETYELAAHTYVEDNPSANFASVTWTRGLDYHVFIASYAKFGADPVLDTVIETREDARWVGLPTIKQTSSFTLSSFGTTSCGITTTGPATVPTTTLDGCTLTLPASVSIAACKAAIDATPAGDFTLSTESYSVAIGNGW